MIQIGCVVFSDEDYKEFLDNKSKIKDLIEKVAESKLEITWCHLKEDVEGDMRSVSGSYSIHDVIDRYDRYVKEAAWEGAFTISVHGRYKDADVMILMWPREGNFIFKSSDSQMSIDDVLTGK